MSNIYELKIYVNGNESDLDKFVDYVKDNDGHPLDPEKIMPEPEYFKSLHKLCDFKDHVAHNIAADKMQGWRYCVWGFKGIPDSKFTRLSAESARYKLWLANGWGLELLYAMTRIFPELEFKAKGVDCDSDPNGPPDQMRFWKVKSDSPYHQNDYKHKIE